MEDDNVLQPVNINITLKATVKLKSTTTPLT